MVRITDKQIEAMANTIQYSENVGTAFIMDDEAIERVKEAIEFIGVGNGIEWSTTVMKRAVQMQEMKHKQENNKQKEIEKYEKKLSDLLDGLVYFSDDKDKKEHTPRSYFEDNFKQLIETPFMYFLNISRDTDNEVADLELKEFILYGGGAKGAFSVIDREIRELIGWTLDIKTERGKE